MSPMTSAAMRGGMKMVTGKCTGTVTPPNTLHIHQRLSPFQYHIAASNSTNQSKLLNTSFNDIEHGPTAAPDHHRTSLFCASRNELPLRHALHHIMNHKLHSLPSLLHRSLLPVAIPFPFLFPIPILPILPPTHISICTYNANISNPLLNSKRERETQDKLTPIPISMLTRIYATAQ